MSAPNPERFRIQVEATHTRAVSALWHAPPRDTDFERIPILLAHGSGFHMESPWMSALAEGLVARGFPLLRFNYPYRERALAEGKQMPPDRMPVLEAAHERALEELLARTDGQRPLLAGKSLGARVSTILAAKDCLAAGLLLFGYPLHPPKRPDKLRHEHFGAIVQPALFLQGTRDALCDLALLSEALLTYGGSATVARVEGADHGFHVLKSSGTTDDEVLADLVESADRWSRETIELSAKE